MMGLVLLLARPAQAIPPPDLLLTGGTALLELVAFFGAVLGLPLLVRASRLGLLRSAVRIRLTVGRWFGPRTQLSMLMLVACGLVATSVIRSESLVPQDVARLAELGAPPDAAYIDHNQLAQQLDRGTPVLFVDVRSRRQYAKSHFEDALWVPEDDFGAVWRHSSSMTAATAHDELLIVLVCDFGVDRSPIYRQELIRRARTSHDLTLDPDRIRILRPGFEWALHTPQVAQRVVHRVPEALLSTWSDLGLVYPLTDEKTSDSGAAAGAAHRQREASLPWWRSGPPRVFERAEPGASEPVLARSPLAMRILGALGGASPFALLLFAVLTSVAATFRLVELRRFIHGRSTWWTPLPVLALSAAGAVLVEEAAGGWPATASVSCFQTLVVLGPMRIEAFTVALLLAFMGTGLAAFLPRKQRRAWMIEFLGERLTLPRLRSLGGRQGEPTFTTRKALLAFGTIFIIDMFAPAPMERFSAPAVFFVVGTLATQPLLDGVVVHALARWLGRSTSPVLATLSWLAPSGHRRRGVLGITTRSPSLPARFVVTTPSGSVEVSVLSERVVAGETDMVPELGAKQLELFRLARRLRCLVGWDFDMTLRGHRWAIRPLEMPGRDVPGEALHDAACAHWPEPPGAARRPVQLDATSFDEALCSPRPIDVDLLRLRWSGQGGMVRAMRQLGVLPPWRSVERPPLVALGPRVYRDLEAEADLFGQGSWMERALAPRVELFLQSAALRFRLEVQPRSHQRIEALKPLLDSRIPLKKQLRRAV